VAKGRRWLFHFELVSALLQIEKEAVEILHVVKDQYEKAPLDPLTRHVFVNDRGNHYAAWNEAS
jgi:hypothetical protein